MKTKYIINEDPDCILIICKDLAQARAFSRKRIAPMINEVPWSKLTKRQKCERLKRQIEGRISVLENSYAIEDLWRDLDKPHITSARKKGSR